jgi:hypothetical protein
MRRVNAIVLAAAAVLLFIVACLDTTPPTVTITYPANEASLAKDTIRIKAYATDNVSVAKVEFSVDGTLLSTQTSSDKDTFSYLWDATTAADGGHGIVVTAYDGANNRSRDSIHVTFQLSDATPPTITITHPTNGATLARDTIRIKAYATDNVGVAKVEFRVDAALLSTQTGGSNDTFSYLWDATSAAVGGHAITARAYDTANNTKQDSVYSNLTGGGGSGTHHSGEISASETWYRAGSPHFIDDDVYVDNNATLTIMPGCTVKFSSGTELYSGYNSPGAIVAVGKTDSTILFTSNAPSPAAGDWKRVSLYSNTMANARFGYCTIEYGGEAGSNKGEIYIDGNHSAAIDHCNIERSADYGIVCTSTGCFSSLTNCAIAYDALYPIDIYPNDIRHIDASNTIVFNNGHDGVWVENGTGSNAVTTSQTWPVLLYPYFLSSDVEVAGPSGPTLTLQPGTTIKLENGVELYCGYADAGAISAVGTASSQITFTSATASPAPGNWKDIGLYSGATASTRFAYCKMEYGGAAGSNKGEIFIDGNHNATIDHCTIKKSGDYGIVCTSSGCFSSLTNCTIDSCARYVIDIYPNDIRSIGAANSLYGGSPVGVWVENGTGSNAIVASETLRYLDVPYCLSSDVEVAGPSGPTLTIVPGVQVKMANNVELYCGYSNPGAINAVSGAPTHIFFTSLLSSPSPGSWKDIGFYSEATNQSKLDYCVVEYAGGEPSHAGNVYIDNTALPVIRNSTIQNSAGYGIYLDGSSYPDTAQLRATNTFNNDPSGDIRVP